MEGEPLRWRDGVLPGALVVLGTAELVYLGIPGWGLPMALEMVAGGLLVFRRRYPLVVAPAAAVALLTMPLDWVQAG